MGGGLAQKISPSRATFTVTLVGEVGVVLNREVLWMQSEDDSLIREMVDTIVREANPDTVILFGSRARGDARPDSDVDLLIVEPEPFSPQRNSAVAARKLRACTWPCASWR